MAAVTALAALGLIPCTAAAAQHFSPTLSPANTVIDGPSPSIVGLTGLSVARDGTGGVVYLKDVGGTAHVFVSRLLLGLFQAPEQVDAGLPGSSSQPVIAAAATGVLLIAFINGGQLYTVGAANALSPFGHPAVLFAAATAPALSMSSFGKAYLAFTSIGAAGDDVRVAYYDQGQWTLIAPPLNITPGDNAARATGRPAVATAGDGVAIVAWGEAGHVYARRVWGVSPGPSVVAARADVPSLGGLNEVSADEPAVSAGGDSSYAAVVFRETLTDGSTQQTRVLMNQLHGSGFTGVAPADGATTPGPQGSDHPQVAVNEYGRGFATSDLNQSDDVFAMPIATNDSPGAPERLNSQVIAGVPDAVPATAGLTSNFIVWQQAPGSAGGPEIRLRYAPDGVDLDSEQVISSPGLGATDAASGLAAGGDQAGDAVAAWVQGTGAGTQIVAGQLYQAPGDFVAADSFTYATSVEPVLAWSSAAEAWGPARYAVTFDGAVIANTTATAVTTPAPVTNGRHVWQVTAVNQAGLSTVADPATVFVDTVAPQVSITLTGTRRIGVRLRLRVRYTDAPPPLPTSAASGVKSVQVRWGDGSEPFIRVGRSYALHTYRRHRAYTVTVIVADRAGNTTVVKRRIKIASRNELLPHRHKHRSSRKRRRA